MNRGIVRVILAIIGIVAAGVLAYHNAPIELVVGVAAASGAHLV